VVDNNTLQELSHQLMPLEQILVLIEAVVLASYIVMRYRAQGSALKSVRLLLNGKYRLVFWVGIVGLGLLLPVILELIQSILPEYPYILYITGASALTGGFFLRYGVVKSGIKDLHPLHKMLVLQYDWKALEKPAYMQEKEVSHG